MPDRSIHKHRKPLRNEVLLGAVHRHAFGICRDLVAVCRHSCTPRWQIQPQNDVETVVGDEQAPSATRPRRTESCILQPKVVVPVTVPVVNNVQQCHSRRVGGAGRRGSRGVSPCCLNPTPPRLSDQIELCCPPKLAQEQGRCYHVQPCHVFLHFKVDLL